MMSQAEGSSTMGYWEGEPIAALEYNEAGQYYLVRLYNGKSVMVTHSMFKGFTTTQSGPSMYHTDDGTHGLRPWSAVSWSARDLVARAQAQSQAMIDKAAYEQLLAVQTQGATVLSPVPTHYTVRPGPSDAYSAVTYRIKRFIEELQRKAEPDWRDDLELKEITYAVAREEAREGWQDLKAQCWEHLTRPYLWLSIVGP